MALRLSGRMLLQNLRSGSIQRRTGTTSIKKLSAEEWAKIAEAFTTTPAKPGFKIVREVVK